MTYVTVCYDLRLTDAARLPAQRRAFEHGVRGGLRTWDNVTTVDFGNEPNFSWPAQWEHVYRHQPSLVVQ